RPSSMPPFLGVRLLLMYERRRSGWRRRALISRTSAMIYEQEAPRRREVKDTPASLAGGSLRPLQLHRLRPGQGLARGRAQRANIHRRALGILLLVSVAAPIGARGVVCGSIEGAVREVARHPDRCREDLGARASGLRDDGGAESGPGAVLQYEETPAEGRRSTEGRTTDCVTRESGGRARCGEGGPERQEFN